MPQWHFCIQIQDFPQTITIVHTHACDQIHWWPWVHECKLTWYLYKVNFIRHKISSREHTGEILQTGQTNNHWVKQAKHNIILLAVEVSTDVWEWRPHLKVQSLLARAIVDRHELDGLLLGHILAQVDERESGRWRHTSERGPETQCACHWSSWGNYLTSSAVM